MHLLFWKKFRNFRHRWKKISMNFHLRRKKNSNNFSISNSSFWPSQTISTIHVLASFSVNFLTRLRFFCVELLSWFFEVRLKMRIFGRYWQDFQFTWILKDFGTFKAEMLVMFGNTQLVKFWSNFSCLTALCRPNYDLWLPCWARVGFLWEIFGFLAHWNCMPKEKVQNFDKGAGKMAFEIPGVAGATAALRGGGRDFSPP